MSNLATIENGLILGGLGLALSIQLFAPVREHALFLMVAGILIYLGFGWFLRTRYHRKLPLAVVFAGISFLLMTAVLTTGGLGSVFYPLVFILAFVAIVIFDKHEPLIFLLGATVALWASAGGALDLQSWILLGSLIAIFPLSILAEQLKQSTAGLNSIAQELTDDKLQTTVFISTFVLPKLRILHQLVDDPIENKDGIQKQLLMIILQLEEELHPAEETQDDPSA